MVPDHLLEAAEQALIEDNGPDLPCPMKACTEDDCRSIVRPTHVLPDAHVHLYKPPPLYEREWPHLWLYRQSSVLWTLPPLDERYLHPQFGGDEAQFHATISPHYVLSTDTKVCPSTRRSRLEDDTGNEELYHQPHLDGLGVWDESLFPALAPKPILAVEALARMVVRHYWTNREFSLDIHMSSMGKAEQKLKGEFYSFEDLHPLVLDFVHDWRTTKRASQVALELSRHWGERGTEETIMHMERLDRMFR